MSRIIFITPKDSHRLKRAEIKLVNINNPCCSGVETVRGTVLIKETNIKIPTRNQKLFLVFFQDCFKISFLIFSTDRSLFSIFFVYFVNYIQSYQILGSLTIIGLDKGPLKKLNYYYI